jgi:hypothetical protein
MMDKANRAMQRVTGLRVTRETPEERAAAIREASQAAAKRARRNTAEKWKKAEELRNERRRERQAARAAERRAAEEERRREREAQRLAEQERRRAEAQAQREAEARAREEARATGADLPGPFDDQKRAVIAKVRERTMTGVPKMDALVEAVRYVAREKIPGEIVECGVWRGGSMQAIALVLQHEGDTERELHLYDTFEGMPEPTAEDTRTWWGETRSAKELLEESDKDSDMWAIAGLDDVKQAMAESGYPAERIHYYPGMVEDTIPDQAPEQIALLRLDTDWYSSTKHELEHLYDRLVPGGVLILDDYGDWDGARKAIDEWVASRDEKLFLVPMGWGRIAVKPR